MELNDILFSTEHNQVGKVTNMENPTIENKAGESFEVDLDDCRAANEDELATWNTEETEVADNGAEAQVSA